MHIPDGYLSPATCGAFGVTMVPMWSLAGRRVRTVVSHRYVPLLGVAAAYCFLVMMFNVPVPDGTTAHAVGAVLVAVLLGPEAAVIAVSVALAIQALFFGDGGVLSFAVNSFNMAVVMPYVGFTVYRIVARRSSLTSSRRAFAAGLGGYIGLNTSALVAAVEFGLQPVLFHSANGTPLYAPFHLSQTLPTMALAHLTVAGTVEFALTAGVVAYLQKANLPLLRINRRNLVGGDVAEAKPPAPGRLGWRTPATVIGTLVLLAPIGLLAPGGAFGEQKPGDIDVARYGLNVVPDGLRRYAGFWHHALFNGYDYANDKHPAAGYLASAVFGIVVVGLLVVIAIAAVKASRRGSPEGKAVLPVHR
jgi:cobalt/nickel transport system permease protein